MVEKRKARMPMGCKNPLEVHLDLFYEKKIHLQFQKPKNTILHININASIESKEIAQGMIS